MTDIILPIVIMGVLGFFFSSGLVFAYKLLRVEEDPKIEQIYEILPHGNCGACGYSGCRVFAEMVVRGETTPGNCPVAGEEASKKIAEILGIKAKEVIKKVARVHCRGTPEAAKSRGIYLGIPTCAAAQLTGGNKQCSWGCLGYGDCARACPFDAIHINEANLPVVSEDRCTGCGLCVDVCPRNIIELHPSSQKVIVFCRSQDRGPTARKACKNACIACGICTRACPEGIILKNNLAKIVDHEKMTQKIIKELEKCPTGAIGCRKETKRTTKENI